MSKTGITACLSVIFLLPCICLSSSVYIDQAWQAWADFDLPEVEENFLQALQLDADDLQALMGLTFLYNMQRKHESAWEYYSQVLEKADNPYPYYAAILNTGMFSKLSLEKNSEAMQMVEKFSSRNLDPGILQAKSCQRMGDYYLKMNELDKAEEYYGKIGQINTWMLNGPFENISGSGFDKVYEPELDYRQKSVSRGKDGVPCQWFPNTPVKYYPWLDFLHYFGNQEAIFYANTFIKSPDNRRVQLRLGSSGSLKAFLNDHPVLGIENETNNDLDTYIVEIELESGWNRLLLKLGYSEITQCNFLCRITDSDGNSLDDLKYEIKSHSYPKNSGFAVSLMEDPSEAYFRNQILSFPEKRENYILLTFLYLANDKSTETELVLQKLAELEPDCALIKYHLLEAYARQEKYDEYSSTMEYLYSRKLSIPLVIIYMINKYMSAEDFDKVYELIQDLEQLLPDSPELHYAYIQYFGGKELYEKFLNMINTAYDLYPYDDDFVSIKALLEINASNNYNEAINIYQKALEGNYSINNLTVLANCYLENSQLEKWDEIMLAARELFPSSSSFCYSMAQVYYNYQLYDKAYQLADSALQISPGVGAYWNLLGKISQFLGEPSKTIEAYQQAVKYDPTNYEARALIREFEGKKSIFNVFPVNSLEEMIAAAPDASEYPNDNSLILLHDLKKVVYEFGGSEFQNEILIKILTRTGIEEHTEMKIPYNYYNQVLTIEEAIVVKSNGEKIKADIDQNTVVIKNIEVNDFIYLRWKLKDYFSGELLANFWDQVNFNFFYPAKKIRYSLLVPADKQFEYSCQNFELEPVLDKTPEGDLYVWELSDEPAVEHEYGMPDLDYCGKILHFSSIPDWEFIIDWFSDLAYNKTKITYEIEELINDLLPKQEYSEEEKISLIYEFITENITYSSVSFRQSRFVPQKARDVLTTKIGDCKDMSCLMITMLKEAGINADFVLINTNNQGQPVKALPSTNAFNHCIVAVHTESGVKFFDPTAKNYPVGSIPTSDKQAFYLVINDNTTSPAYLAPDQFMKNMITRESEVKVDEHDSITISNVCSKSGEVGASMRYAYRHISEKERNKKLHEILSRDHQNCNLISFNLIDPDALEQEFLYDYSYEVPNYLENVGNYKLMVLPWADKLTTESSIFMDERDYPFIWNGNVDVYQARINVNLPSGWMPLELPETISYSCSNAEYNINLVFEDGVISGERNLIFNSKNISPEEYPAFREFYHNVVKADQTKILLTSP